MSRIGLHRPRRSRAASRRPAPDTRLLPGSFLFPPDVLHPNTHYKRCPKDQRLGLRSDQSPLRPLQGRSPDTFRHALTEGSCQVRAPLIGRNGFAPTGDAKEHGVMLLHRATAPFSDSPGIHPVGLSEQSDKPRLKTKATFWDSTVVTIGKLRSMNGGHGSSLSPLGVVEHFRWARLPQSEIFSCLVHILSEVWGCDSTVVTTGMFRSTNGGHGSMLSPLGVLERFRWARLPQSENISRLVHIPSGVWGCRRFDAGVDRPRGRTPRIGTGVADILRKPSGTFHHLPRLAMSSRGPARDLKGPSQDMAFTAVHPHPTSGSVRGTASRSLKEWAGMRLMPSPPTSTKLEGSTCPESLKGMRGTKVITGVGPLVLRLSKCERGVAHTRPSRLASHPHLPYAVIPALLPSIELEGEVGAEAPTSPSVLLSPSPLKALRACPESLEGERGTKGERVPLRPLRHEKSPEIPLGVVQSNQLRVQSMFNQRSIKSPPPQLVRLLASRTRKALE